MALVSGWTNVFCIVIDMKHWLLVCHCIKMCLIMHIRSSNVLGLKLHQSAIYIINKFKSLIYQLFELYKNHG